MKELTQELILFTKQRILEKLIPKSILVSEKIIHEYKLGIDPTDITDNNNIKIARSMAEKVFDLLPEIISEVGDEIDKELEK